MSSANYRIQTDILSQGGGGSTSGSYWADDTIGDLATGEDMSSALWRACAGYECFDGEPYITFSVTAGLTSPGVAGDPVELGTLDTATVKTSNGTTVNSIFVTVDSNAPGGNIVTVSSQYNGLRKVATGATIPSASATLVAGTQGYGICVFDTTEDSFSPSAFLPAAPFNGSCTKTTGHAVGEVDTTPTTILTSSDEVSNGEAEILVKAAISGTVESGDYIDTLTFTATGTY